MTKVIKWGILGPGSIAHSFAQGLAVTNNGQVYAAASRNVEKAQKFIDEYGGTKAYGSYNELVQDPDVDAIYVATPHTHHVEHTKLCLNAKKPTLCEKPFAVNAKQAKEMVACAKENNTFLMEAMWTRFFPLMYDLRKKISEGVIGEVRLLQADFGYRFHWDPKNRILAPDLAGGGLLDVGIYCVSTAYQFIGKPKTVSGKAHLGESGVDEQNAFIFEYENGALAVMCSGVRTSLKHELRIYGTEGHVVVHEGFWRPTKMTIHTNGKDEVFEYDTSCNGYNYEADAVANYLSEGKVESDIIPLEESISMMESMDALRKQWGLIYPGE